MELDRQSPLVHLTPRERQLYTLRWWIELWVQFTICVVVFNCLIVLNYVLLNKALKGWGPDCWFRIGYSLCI